MSLAQRFERRLEGLVGGAFARVFKGQVEPVEIGKALQREAADKRNVMGADAGSGAVLTPNRYRVTLSPSDHERLAPWEVQLTSSLAELVQDYLDENRWDTVGDIEVYLARDDELRTGVFGVASRMESAAPPRRRPHDSLLLPAVPAQAAGAYPPAGQQPYGQQPYGQQPYGQQYAPPPEQYAPEQFPRDPYAPPSYGQRFAPPPQRYGPPPGAPMPQPPMPPGMPQPPMPPGMPQPPMPQPPMPMPPGGGPQPPPRPAGAGLPAGGPGAPVRPPAQGARPAAAMLIIDQSNRRYDLRAGSNIVGRGTDSDLQLLDQGISRRHLDVQFDGHYATACDLGSTNGTTVNGHEIGNQVLRHGDVLRVGHTRIVFHQERP